MSKLSGVDRDDLVRRRDELREWVEALRSGEFTQGYGALTRYWPRDGRTEYCCLGVKCELDARVGRHDVVRRERSARVGDDSVTYGAYRCRPARADESEPPVAHDDQSWQHYELPSRVADALGFRNACGEFDGDVLSHRLRVQIGGFVPNVVSNLVILNDNGVSFTMIADVIQEVWLAPLEARLAEGGGVS